MKNNPLDEQTPIEPLLTAAEQSRMIRQMHRALIGDPFNPKKPGLLQIYNGTHTDYWGDKENGIKGTRDKVEKLWDIRLKIMGGAVALGATGSFIAWAIEHLVWKH